jgi:broad specificity phosphatase PhoE
VRLILVRHGAADAGFHGVIGGERGCGGLNPLGRRQAEALRDRLAADDGLDADVLVASTIPRAIETAEIIAPGLGFETFSRHCDLCEVHPGAADGLEWVEYQTRYGGFNMQDEPDRLFAPEGESWNGFHVRVIGTLERIASEHAGQTVVAVCHAGVIQASMRVLFDIPEPGRGSRLQPTNTGLTEWDHDPDRDRWTLRRFNDAAHLSGRDLET